MASDLPKSPGHPFYTVLNRLLAEHGFDPMVEKLSAPYYADTMRRPSVPPKAFFWMLSTGSFQGLRERPQAGRTHFDGLMSALDHLVASLVWSATRNARAPGS